MTTLEAIELLKSTPPSAATTEQLAALRELLNRTPSVYAVLGGRSQVESYLSEADAAVELTCVPAAETAPQPEAPQAHPQSASPPPLPWNRLWTPRRLLELGVFAALFLAAGVGIVALLWSMFSIEKKPATFIADRRKIIQPAAGSESLGATQKDRIAAVAAPAAGDSLDRWQDWHVTKASSTQLEKQHGWDLTDPARPRPIVRLLTRGGTVTFEGRQIVPPNTASLLIDCRQTSHARAGTLEVSIDGQAIGKVEVPSGSVAEPTLIPVQLAASRNVSLRINYGPGGDNEEVQWSSIRLSDERKEALAVTGEPDAKQPSLRLWLRADRGIQDATGRGPLDPAFDGHVATWKDQASHQFHLVRGSATGPKYMPTEPLLNNQPSLIMGGAHLKHIGHAIYDAPESTSFIVFTVHALARKEYGRYAAIAETSPPTLGWHTGAYHDRRGRYDHEVTFVGCKPIPMVSKRLPMGTFGLLAAASIAGRRSFIEINGRGRSVFESSAEPGGDTFILGGGHTSPGAYGGAIAEVIIFNRRLSDVEVRQIGRYLQARYGIAGDY